MEKDVYVMNSTVSDRSRITENQINQQKVAPFNTSVNNVGSIGDIAPNLNDKNVQFNTTEPLVQDSTASVKSTITFNFPNKLQLFEIQKLIDDHKRESVDYTVILSSVLRQIAFTEGSLFWFLKMQFQVGIISIILGFSALLLFFICDAVQYYNGYSKFKKQAEIFERNMANNLADEADYQDSKGVNLSITLPFKIKLIFLSLATSALIIDLLESLPNLKFY